MLSLILAAAIWGSSFPVITYALRETSPFVLLVLRFVLAFLILLPRLKDLTRFRALFGRDLFLISIPNALSFILQFKAQELTTASKTALFVSSSPVWVAIYNAVVLKSRLTFWQLAAITIAFAGVVVTSTGLDFSDFSTINTGDAMCIFVGICWALVIVYSRDVVKKYGPYTFAHALYFWTALMSLPLLFTEEMRFTAAGVAPAVYLAVFPTILAYYLYMRGVQSVSAVSTSIIILIEVVVAFLIAHFFLGEFYSPVETVGVLMVIAGVVMVLRRSSSPDSGS